MKKKQQHQRKAPIQRPKITFLCVAYNCENYIADTIRSVLNQTEKNIQLILCNNGSTDKTGEICSKYVQKDKRIIYFANKENLITDEGVRYGERDFWPKFDGEYISHIDGDDLLAPEYAEIMYQAAKKNNADIVVCGTTMFDDDTGISVSQRLPPDLIMNQMSRLEPYFSEIYGQFRPIWAKIYKTDFFEQYHEYAWKRPDWLNNGGDTFISLGYLEKCKCLVSIKKSLHYYRIKKKSTFHTQIVDPVRIQAGQLLYERGLKCITNLGIANQQNCDILTAIFFGHMEDLLNLVDRSIEMSISEKMNFFCLIINNPLMQIFCQNVTLFQHLFQRLCKSMDYLYEQENTKILRWSNNFYLRLYLGWRYRDIEDSGLVWGLLFSAIVDSVNCAQFGMYLLKNNKLVQNKRINDLLVLSIEEQKNILKDSSKLISFFLESKNSHDINKKKKEILDLLDNKEYKTALLLLNDILLVNPLDREGIYFKIYTLFQVGDMEKCLLYARNAYVLWPQDEDIQEISRNVLQQYKED